jgi:hypothetical protein
VKENSSLKQSKNSCKSCSCVRSGVWVLFSKLYSHLGKE